MDRYVMFKIFFVLFCKDQNGRGIRFDGVFYLIDTDRVYFFFALMHNLIGK